MTCTALAQGPNELAVPGFSCSTGQYAVRLPQSLQKLRHMATLVAEERPRSEAGWEQYRVLKFPGLELGILKGDQKDTYMLEHATITGPQWRIAEPLRVKSPAAAVFESLQLGQPADGVWKLWGPGPEQALLTIRDGLILQIKYSCYSG